MLFSTVAGCCMLFSTVAWMPNAFFYYGGLDAERPSTSSRQEAFYFYLPGSTHAFVSAFYFYLLGTTHAFVSALLLINVV